MPGMRRVGGVERQRVRRQHAIGDGERAEKPWNGVRASGAISSPRSALRIVVATPPRSTPCSVPDTTSMCA